MRHLPDVCHVVRDVREFYEARAKVGWRAPAIKQVSADLRLSSLLTTAANREHGSRDGPRTGCRSCPCRRLMWPRMGEEVCEW